MNSIIGPIIEGGCTIVGAAIGAIAGARVTKGRMDKKQKEEKDKMQSSVVHALKLNESFFSETCAADKVCLYTVNSYKWANIFQNELSREQSAFIKEVVVFVRKKDKETQEYLKSLKDIIGIWEKLRDEGRIRKLSIYGYKNEPDHYYIKIGDSIVMTGHVYKDASNVTGTSVDLQPIVISKDMNDGKEMIGRYGKHFDGMLEMNKQNVIVNK